MSELNNKKPHERVNEAPEGSANPGAWNLAFLLPDQVVSARDALGLIFLPLAPIEWHGPHMPMGTDPLLAEAFAQELACLFKAPYYPTLFVGTERERSADMLEAIGFDDDVSVEGMDFPSNTIKSGYFREEVFTLVVRETIRLLTDRMKFSHVVIINGHGAANQRDVLNRLSKETNADAGYERLIWFCPGLPRSVIAGSIAHAGAEECSLLLAHYPGSVDLNKLPSSGDLKNVDYAIVDGETFDGSPSPGFVVRSQQDPRRHTDADWGKEIFMQAIEEAEGRIRTMLMSRDRRSSE